MAPQADDGEPCPWQSTVRTVRPSGWSTAKCSARRQQQKAVVPDAPRTAGTPARWRRSPPHRHAGAGWRPGHAVPPHADPRCDSPRPEISQPPGELGLGRQGGSPSHADACVWGPLAYCTRLTPTAAGHPPSCSRPPGLRLQPEQGGRPAQQSDHSDGHQPALAGDGSPSAPSCLQLRLGSATTL